MVMKILKKNKISLPRENIIIKSKKYLVLKNEFPTEISRIEDNLQFLHLFKITSLPENQYKIELKEKV